MTPIHPFPEGSDSGDVEVLHHERLGEQRLAVIVATRHVTFSLSGWRFLAAHLHFVGYQTHHVSPRTPLLAPPAAQQEGEDHPVKRYVIATREGTWDITATGCERHPLEGAHLRALADLYAERAGVTRGPLFVLPPEDESSSQREKRDQHACEEDR